MAKTFNSKFITPKLPHLCDHTPVSHRVLYHKRVAFPQKFMQNMAEFERCYAVVLKRLANCYRPKGMASIRMVSSNDCCPD